MLGFQTHFVSLFVAIVMNLHDRWQQIGLRPLAGGSAPYPPAVVQ
jgi:hypothetical protein